MNLPIYAALYHDLQGYFQILLLLKNNKKALNITLKIETVVFTTVSILIILQY